MFRSSTRCVPALLLFTTLIAGAPIHAQSTSVLGVFEGQSDVGSVVPAGAAAYNASTGTYTITAAGINLWAKTDGFHFVWKKLSGDLSLTADIDFPVKTGNPSPHRKAVLMCRQTLDLDGAYADAAQHGSGLTALQYRREKGASTQGIELTIDPPKRVRLEKRDDTFTMFVSNHGEPLHQAGATIKLHLDGPFYVGIGLSSHNPAVTEKATFSNVELKQLAAPATPAKKVLYSTLQALAIDPGARRSDVVLSGPEHFMAPNWSRDGKSLIYTQDGRIYRVPVEGGTPQAIEMTGLTGCTGSHGLSPDGKWLAATCAMGSAPEKRLYVVPLEGGAPRLVTQNPGSYFHSWSPDGKTFLFTRSAHGTLNIYAIPFEGGTETAITSGTGISDDPDYSPDGKYIYFNTDRWGGMQIARMKPDGSQVEQVTFDDNHIWTPHPSPDGQSIVFISYDQSVSNHAANKDVTLRIMSTADNKIRELTTLVGGDGTMNVANWSPDSKRLAFVSYQMLPAEDAGTTE